MVENDKTWQNGIFQLHGEEIWGQLSLAGRDSQLKVRVEGRRKKASTPNVIYGRLHDFKSVSCVACVGGDLPSTNWSGEGKVAMSWTIFPHQVLIGSKHFEPNNDRIRKVWFSTTDIYRIFEDYDSFGAVWDPSPQLQSALPQIVGDRPVPFGPDPRVAFFAGRSKLLDIELEFGKFEVQRWVSVNSNSSEALIDSQMRIHVEFKQALDLENCLQKIRKIAQFLSLVGGRSQGVENLTVALDNDDSASLPLTVHWSLGPEAPDRRELDIPSAFDMPLDGIRRESEFREVMQRWFASDEHEVARLRLYSCRQFGNQFNADRLVAAANLFDLTSTIPAEEVHSDLAKALETCLAALENAPKGDDRDSVIQAIKRVGAPTLRKKVLARSSVLKRQIQLENLDKVLREAVLCRNYFVHGPGDKRFNYPVVEPYIYFLTETLEFIFAAAELIECGWDGAGWNRQAHTSHHWFVLFLRNYDYASNSLLLALQNAKKVSQSNKE